MASQSSGSKPKKGFRSFLKETLHVRSRSKSPSQPSNQQAQQLGIDPGLPSGTASTAKAPDLGQSDDGEGLGREPGITRTDIARPSSFLHPAWAELGGALESLRSAAVPFPTLVSIVELFLSCLDQLQIVAKSWLDHEDQATNLAGTCNSLIRSIRELGSASTTNAVLSILISLELQVAGLRAELDHEAGLDTSLVAYGQNDPKFYYGLIIRLFQQLEANLSVSPSNTTNETMIKALFEWLNPAKDYTHNSGGVTDVSRTCIGGTRTGVLANLDKWIENQTPCPVFWLSGTEGIGKTTIARTFCERVDDQKLLAASFFCTRTNTVRIDPAQIVRMIAYQLAEYSVPVQRALHETLDRSPEIDSKDSLQLFEQLIQQPLAEANDTMPASVVIVIDGLDESGSQEGYRLMLGILERYANEVPMKFLVTSRRKLEARAGISGHGQCIRTFHLDDIERLLIRHDLTQYFQAELHSLTPTTTQLERLVDRTDMLFICAVVLVRFILLDSPRCGPQKRLELVLSMTLESTRNHIYIDALYTAILHSVLEEEAMDEVERGWVQTVLWTVLFAQESIGVDTIATLAGIDDLQDVRSALRPLRPVLVHSEESGLVVPLHASFPEFMLNSERSGVFFYDIAEHSRVIAERCFGVMEAGLRFNICGLESSFIPDREVDSLEDRVRERVSPTLAYACRYWANHLGLTAICNRLKLALEEFLSDRLLFWMEVLNLRREIGAGVKALTKTSQWLKDIDAPSQDLDRAVQDACDFVTSYAANPVSESTPHIYLSALPFCPRSSRVYKNYLKRTAGLLQLQGNVMEHRGTAPLAIWNIGHIVISIAYSPDGNLLAFGCESGPVGIFDTHDGSLVAGPPKCEIESDTRVAFSPDGSKLAVGSQDGIIEVWNVANWELVTGPLRGHSRTVTSVAFSPDGTLLVSASRDRTVRIWSVKDGTLAIGPLEGHGDLMIPVAFSPDGTRVASASSNHAVRLWDIREDMPAYMDFIGHTYVITSIAFTPDGTRLVSGARDLTARVWSTSENASQAGLSIPHPNCVDSLAILPNGRHFASGTRDYNIYVWDMEDGTLIAGPFFGHRLNIEAIAISPDGTRVASGSNDRTIGVWPLYEGVLSPPRLNEGTFDITFITFSPTESRICSTSRTGANIWDVEQGTLFATVTSGERHSTHSLPVSPDGTSVTVFLDDYSVEVVSTEDGKIVAGPFRGHTGSITSAAFSSDGAYLVTGSEDCTVCVWTVGNPGVAAGPFVGHTAAVTMVELSSDGSRAVSCSSDRTIRVWNVHDSIIEVDASHERGTYNLHTSVFEGWTVRDDGWVVNGECSLLFWTPLDFPVQLSPHTELSITRHYGSTAMPKQKVLLGPIWDRCYVFD